MARKSPWQQFSDNFSSVYGTIKEAGQGIETARVMREKPEEEMVAEGPRNSYQRATGKYNYGGKTYDKEITPDMLRGLQYNRLGDVMAKYGQADKALDMEYKAEQVRELQSKNRVSESTEAALITRADLENVDLTATTGARIAGTNYDVAKTTELYAKLGPDLQKIFLEMKKLKLNNRQELVKAEIAEATQDEEEKAAKQAAKLKGTTAELENNANVSLLEYSKIIKDGGNFTNKNGKKITGTEWLREGWTGDAKTLEVLKNIEDDELNQLMREGTMIIENVKAALTGTRDVTEPAILKLIDDQDSIPNNVNILQSTEGEFLRMVQTDENGENPIVIAEGDNWSMFSDNLIASITPMKAVTLAKANADIALVQAQTAEINAKIANNGIDIQKVNTEWAGIQEKMVELGKTPLEISTQKNAFVDSYITKTKGLGAGSSNNGDGFGDVITIP